MKKESEIQKLENYVESLLEGYTALKAEKSRLEWDLLEQQAENNRLQQLLDNLDSERGEVSSRVSSLIERIERWESESEEEAEEAEEAKPKSKKADDSEENPEEDEEEDQPEGDDRGGGVQGNLFKAQPSA